MSGSNKFFCDGTPMGYGGIYFLFFSLVSVIFAVYYYWIFKRYRITDEP